MTIPIAAIAVVFLVSPRTLDRFITRGHAYKAGWGVLFMRVAAVLALIGAIWTWLDWLRSR